MSTMRPISDQLESGWENKPRTFSMATLQDNWSEDRIQAPEDTPYHARTITSRGYDPDLVKVAEDTDGRNLKAPVVNRHVLPGTARVIPVHTPIAKSIPYKAGPQDYTTANQAAHSQKSRYSDGVKKATMVTMRNFASNTSLDRSLPSKSHKGFGATLPSHPPSEHATYYETTNQAFFERLPDEVRTMRMDQPLPDKGDDVRFLGGYPASANPNKPDAGPQFEGSKLFNRTKSLVADFYDESKGRETQSRGRAGTRWEMAQAPGESGSRYGDSVFLDVYQAESKPPGSATVCL